MDPSKVFDSITHASLLNKLNDLGVRRKRTIGLIPILVIENNWMK